MTLHPDWKKIVARAWSVRFIAMAGLGAFAEGIANAYSYGLTAALPMLIVGGLSAAGAVARVVSQKGFDDA